MITKESGLVITWACIPQKNFYLVTCRRGELELFEIIQRKDWARIDRLLIFKRAIESMKRTMHSVICAGIE